LEPYADEIDLREYILVLWSYRKMIAGLFLAAVIASALISLFVLDPVYQSHATIYLGNFNSPIYSNHGGAQGILHSDELLTKVAQKYLPDFEPEDLENFKKTVKVESVSGTPYMLVAVSYKDPAAARNMVQMIIDLFREQSQPVYERDKALLTEQLESVKIQLEQVKRQVAEAEAALAGIEKTDLTDTGRDYRRSQTLEALKNLNAQQMSLESSYYSLQKSLQNLKPLRVVSGPNLPLHHIKPNKKLNVAIAGVLSLMTGVFLAFILEYFRRNPLDLKTGNNKVKDN